jgi:hypothetical protein
LPQLHHLSTSALRIFIRGPAPHHVPDLRSSSQLLRQVSFYKEGKTAFLRVGRASFVHSLRCLILFRAGATSATSSPAILLVCHLEYLSAAPHHCDGIAAEALGAGWW